MRAHVQTTSESWDQAPQDGLDTFETVDATPSDTNCLCSLRSVERGLEEHLDRLWRFALIRCSDQATADDLVQATCLRALEKAHQFAPGTRLDSWLFTILESIWRNTLRSQSVRRGQGIVDIAETSLESTDADEATRIELADATRAIAHLPEGQRAVLLLVCVEGQSYSEAAAILNVPIGTVMSRLSAARSRLKSLHDHSK